MVNSKAGKKTAAASIDTLMKSKIDDDFESSTSATVVVVDTDPRFYGRGLAFISNKVANDLQLQNEDYIEIRAVRTTYALCQIMVASEEFMDTTSNLPPIQIDSNTRKNAGIVLGDKVKIRKIVPQNAERVVFALQEEVAESDRIKLNPERLRRYLKNMIVKKTDEIWIPTKDISQVISPTEEGESPDKLAFHPDIYYLVFHIAPVLSDSPCVKITDKTDIIIRENPVMDPKTVFNEPLYLDEVGGLATEKQLLKELIGFKVFQSETLRRSHFKFANAILLTGQSGTGKTLLAKSIVNEFPVCSFVLNGPELIGDKPQSTPQELNKIVDEAIRCSPSIIVIDEIEALATNREDLKFDAISRNIVVATLLMIDRIAQTSDVILIGTTNKAESIDPAFRATHRFSKEIKFFTPRAIDREEILKILVKHSPLLDPTLIDLHKVAEEANGFTGGDMHMLVQEAFIDRLKEIGLYDQFIATPLKFNEICDKIKLTTNNFLTILKSKVIKPSMLRSYLVETPKATFNDVGGLMEAKRTLEETIKFPQLYPDLYQKFGARRTKGILLYGPPGCGKTLLAKALASESNMNFIYIKAAEVLNRWLGESEAAVREIFAKARAAAPCIVFFDELDAISSTRGIDGNVHSDRVTAQILTEIDGLEELKNVICIGATNRLDIIDAAIMRPGRLYPIIKIDFPNDKEREEIFKIHLRNKPIEKDIDVHELAMLTPNMGGANIEEICHEASVLVIRENINAMTGKAGTEHPASKIARKHFLKAIEEVKKKTQLGENGNPRLYV